MMQATRSAANALQETASGVVGARPQRATFDSKNRVVSLSNLFDVGIDDLDEALGGETAPQDTGSEATARRQKSKTAPQWKRKNQVIEAINELIDELDNIQQSITIQGVEHIHAKEVSPSLA